MKIIDVCLVYVLLFFINTVSGLSQSEMEAYVSKTILEIHWGHGPTEIGFKENVLSSLPGGLSSFAVDEDENIYLLDCVNKQVKVFNSGELIKSFSVNICLNSPMGMYLAVDEQANIWIHESGCSVFRKYSSNGTLMKSIHYQSESRLWPNFRVIDEEVIFLSPARLDVPETSKNKGINGEPVFEAELTRNFPESESKMYFQKYSGRNYYFVHPEDTPASVDHPQVEIREENGEKHILVLEDVDPSIYSYNFLKEDRGGNVYVISSTLNDTMLLKYNNDRELITKQYIGAYNSIGLLYDRVTMDLNGNFFFINTDESGIQIIKWYKQ